MTTTTTHAATRATSGARRRATALLAAAVMGGGLATAVAPGDARAATAAASRDATIATALSGRIPCSIGAKYDLGCGRMKNGRLKLNRGTSPHAHIEIKNIARGGRRTSIRLVDVAGDARKEAVVIISANAGSVAWSNTVLVYDGHGRLLSTWSSRDAIQVGRKGGAWGAQEGTTFGRSRAYSVDLKVEGIATGDDGSWGNGVDVYRLSKGKNGKPVFRLITRR